MADIVSARPYFDGISSELLSMICEELSLTSKDPSEYDVKNATVQTGDVIKQEQFEGCPPDWVLRSQIEAEAWKGLYSLSLTSKRCNRAVVKYLYTDIDLSWLLEPSKQHRVNIIGTLLTNQTLGQIATSLVFVSVTVGVDYTATESPFSRWVDRVLCEIIIGKCPHAMEHWIQLDADLRDMLVFEVLLERLENLRAVDTRVCWASEWMPSSSLVPTLSSVTLPKLKSFRYIGDEFLHDLDYPLTLMAKSRIDNVGFQNYYDCENFALQPSETVNFDALKSLKLFGCLLSKQRLEDILERCPSIVTFAYTSNAASNRYYDVDEECDNLDNRVTVPEIISALQRYKEILESLTISVNVAWPDKCGFYRMDNSVNHSRTILSSSLHGFKRLRELHLDRLDLLPPLQGDFSELLCGRKPKEPMSDDTLPAEPPYFFEELPPSLVILGIRRMTRSILPMFLRLPEMMKNGTLPNLQTLRFPIEEANGGTILWKELWNKYSDYDLDVEIYDFESL